MWRHCIPGVYASLLAESEGKPAEFCADHRHEKGVGGGRVPARYLERQTTKIRTAWTSEAGNLRSLRRHGPAADALPRKRFGLRCASDVVFALQVQPFSHTPQMSSSAPEGLVPQTSPRDQPTAGLRHLGARVTLTLPPRIATIRTAPGSSNCPSRRGPMRMPFPHPSYADGRRLVYVTQPRCPFIRVPDDQSNAP